MGGAVGKPEATHHFITLPSGGTFDIGAIRTDILRPTEYRWNNCVIKTKDRGVTIIHGKRDCDAIGDAFVRHNNPKE